MVTEPVPTELEVVTADWSLDLMDWNDLDNGVSVHIQVQAQGSSFGSPVPLRQALRSAMRDGSRSGLTGHDNRGFPLKLRMTAPDGVALGTVEGMLFQLASKPAEMVWRPGDVGSLPTVFVLDYADLEYEGSQFGDEQVIHDYTLQVKAQPFTFSEDFVTIEALPRATPTITAVTSWATGWTVTAGDAAVSVDGGDLVVTGNTTLTTTIRRAGALLPVVSGGYLVLKHTRDSAVQVIATRGALGAEATPLTPVARYGQSTTYDTSMAGAEGWQDLTIKVTTATAVASGVELLRIMDADWSTAPSIAPPRQQQMVLEVPGSARTPAAILIKSETSALGDVILYVGPEYPPALSSAGIASTPGVDVTTVSGYRLSIGGGVDSTVSQSYDTLEGLVEGNHVLWARCRGQGAPGTVSVTAKYPHAAVTKTVETSLSHADGDWHLRLLGSMRLPVVVPSDRGEASRTDFTLDLEVTDPATDVLEVDEVWPFNVTEGSLVIVRAGAAQRVWFDPATLTTDHPMVWIGSTDAPDDPRKSLARPASLNSELLTWPGDPELTVPVTNLYVVTTEATDATVSGTFRTAHFLHQGM